MSNNNFDILISVNIDEKKTEVKFDFFIKINDEIVNKSHLTDIYGVLSLISNKNRNWTYFWNCECGIPDCANIESCSIKKTKVKDEIFILIPVPCSSNDFKENSYDYWVSNHKKVIVKTSLNEIAKKLWQFSNQLEEDMNKYSSKYRILPWSINSGYTKYEWPDNLPVYIRTVLLKNGFSPD